MKKIRKQKRTNKQKVLLLTSDIRFRNPETGEELVFDFVNEVEIKSSWKTLTDTAKITIPRKLKIGDKRITDVIKRGFTVVIKLGYDGNLNEEYSGYVTRVEPNIPAVIYCEDEMWKLKQTVFNLSYTKVSLKELVAKIAPGYPAKVLTANLGTLRISNASAAKVLEKLKEEFGFVSYFRKGTLHVGFAYDIDRTYETVTYGFEHNIIKNDLEYRTKEDARVQVKAVSIMADNTRYEAKLGDDGGETRTLTFYNLHEADLKKRAQELIDKLKTDGYRGGIEAFGLPVIKHGDVAELGSTEYPERGGKYYADEVNTTFGVRGFRRNVKVGDKAA